MKITKKLLTKRFLIKKNKEMQIITASERKEYLNLLNIRFFFKF